MARARFASVTLMHAARRSLFAAFQVLGGRARTRAAAAEPGPRRTASATPTPASAAAAARENGQAASAAATATFVVSSIALPHVGGRFSRCRLNVVGHAALLTSSTASTATAATTTTTAQAGAHI